MVPQYAHFLNQILMISKYPNNKEQFIKRFEEQNLDDALYNLLDKLPYDKQQAVKACHGDLNKIQHFFTPEEYLKEVCHVYNQALIDFIESLSPTLDEQQKECITALFSQYKTEPQEIFNSLSLQP